MWSVKTSAFPYITSILVEGSTTGRNEMSEYELTDAVNSTLSLFLSTILAYLTIVSAYLIAAFISGDKLTRQQFIAISILFVFAAGLVVWSLWGLGSRIAYTAEALRHANPDHPILFKTLFRDLITMLCVLGIPASFKFMWDVRHPKTE
jgi:hypothetical protein